jgi:hypothetical protein
MAQIHGLWKRTAGTAVKPLLTFLVVCGLVMTIVGQPGMIRAQDKATGQIRASCGGTGTLVLKIPKTKKTVTFTAEDSVFIVPAGKYQLWYYTCTKKDAEGNEWSAKTGLGSRDDEVFDLAAGAVREVKVGPPFSASVKAKTQSDRRVGLDLKIAGTGGDSYRFSCKGTKVSNPGFALTDKNGRKVLTGSFQYG